MDNIIEEEVYYEKIVEVPVETIVERPVYVEKIVERPVYMERIVEVPVDVIVEREIEIPVEKIVEVPIEVRIERPVTREKVRPSSHPVIFLDHRQADLHRENNRTPEPCLR